MWKRKVDWESILDGALATAEMSPLIASILAPLVCDPIHPILSIEGHNHQLKRIYFRPRCTVYLLLLNLGISLMRSPHAIRRVVKH